MKYYGITDRGKLRSTNQDNYVIASNTAGDVFAIVCDGIGGGKGGDVASRMAVSHFSMAFSITEAFTDEAVVRNWLEKEIRSCNSEIYTTGRKYEELRGMGTTFCAMLFCKAGRFVINIGDSRTYSYSLNGQYTQITDDHTLVNDMIRLGELTKEEAENYPRKNVLTNALGVWDHVRWDITRDDRKVSGYLICSDGLHGYVSEETIKSILMNHTLDPALRARKLLLAALDVGGFDNVSVILIDLEGDDTYGG